MRNSILTKVILLIAITCISSCKNKDELYLFEARGRVTNKVTGEPLEGVKITLENGAAGSFLGNTANPDVEDVTYTDVNGFYHVKINANHNHAFLYPSKQGYEFKYKRTETSGSTDGFRYVKRGSQEIDMEMDGIAYFNSPFYKTSAPQKDQDSLKITLLSYEDLSDDLRSLAASVYKGKGTFYFLYDDFPVKAIGDRYLRYKLEFTTDGVWQTKIDSVFLPTSLEVYRDTIYY
jgi:hypothetical protein